ncbi:MAG TPA: TerC family protein [Coriobacteriia bacterium]|nr:TerC family protein [Coriobacteriia bacterium]
MGDLFTISNLFALLTLASLEVVLGIDNLVFIAILTARLPKGEQKKARQLGLAAALITRLLLLFSLSWIASLTNPLFTASFLELHGEPFAVTGQTLVLLIGGLFLIWKATAEIYEKVELKEEAQQARAIKSFSMVIVNIAIMDIIFSLDSVITAVGMVNHLPVMIGGILIAMAVMITFADPVSNFINANPSLKILALAFLIMIGTLLTAEALTFEIPKGFVYFAMFFSLMVDLIQMRYEKNLMKKASAETGE